MFPFGRLAIRPDLGSQRILALDFYGQSTLKSGVIYTASNVTAQQIKRGSIASFAKAGTGSTHHFVTHPFYPLTLLI